MPQTGQSESAFVNEKIDALDLKYIKISIKPVIGFRRPVGFDETFLFIFPDTLLGEIDLTGDLIK